MQMNKHIDPLLREKSACTTYRGESSLEQIWSDRHEYTKELFVEKWSVTKGKILFYPLKRCSVLSSVVALNLEFKLKGIAKGLSDTSTSFQQSANNRDEYIFSWTADLNDVVNRLVSIEMTIKSWNVMNDFTTGLSRFKLSTRNWMKFAQGRYELVSALKPENREVSYNILSEAFSQLAIYDSTGNIWKPWLLSEIDLSFRCDNNFLRVVSFIGKKRETGCIKGLRWKLPLLWKK